MIQWLCKNNIREIKRIAYSEFKQDMKSVGDLKLYEKVLKGDKLGNIDLNYGLIIEDKHSVGIIGYYIPKEDSKAAWLGWFTVKKEFRRRGYGERAISTLIRYLKKTHPELEVLRAYTGSDNIGALKFYNTFGFITENLLVKNAIVVDYNLTKDSKSNLWNKEPIW